MGLHRFTKGVFLQQTFIFSFCEAQQTQSLVSTFIFCSLDVVQIVCWRVKLSKILYRLKSGLLLLSFKSYDCKYNYLVFLPLFGLQRFPKKIFHKRCGYSEFFRYFRAPIPVFICSCFLYECKQIMVWTCVDSFPRSSIRKWGYSSGQWVSYGYQKERFRVVFRSHF